jgi:DNA modification methylase
LPTSSIDCVVTSPPYHLLRHYDAGEREIGKTTDVDEYVAEIVEVCDELARVLKPTGVLWLNLGDSYSRHDRYGAPAKSFLLAPERILIELHRRGWVVRNKVVWAKPNPMPASVRDRLTCAWEPLFMLVRSRDYSFDLDAIREPHRSRHQPAKGPVVQKYGGKTPAWAGPLAGRNDGLVTAHAEGRSGHPLGKNPGDVWSISTAAFKGAHFAVFPERLIERPIGATCPERVCLACGSPWQRALNRRELGALQPRCPCGAAWRPGVVLDPFIGSGTTAIVAERLGRDWLGIELNPSYAELATRRITAARTKASRPPHHDQDGHEGQRKARGKRQRERRYRAVTRDPDVRVRPSDTPQLQTDTTDPDRDDGAGGDGQELQHTPGRSGEATRRLGGAEHRSDQRSQGDGRASDDEPTKRSTERNDLVGEPTTRFWVREGRSINRPHPSGRRPPPE